MFAKSATLFGKSAVFFLRPFSGRNFQKSVLSAAADRGEAFINAYRLLIVRTCCILTGWAILPLSQNAVSPVYDSVVLRIPVSWRRCWLQSMSRLATRAPGQRDWVNRTRVGAQTFHCMLPTYPTRHEGAACLHSSPCYRWSQRRSITRFVGREKSRHRRLFDVCINIRTLFTWEPSGAGTFGGMPALKYTKW